MTRLNKPAIAIKPTMNHFSTFVKTLKGSVLLVAGRLLDSVRDLFIEPAG